MWLICWWLMSKKSSSLHEIKKLSKFEINLLEVGIDELCGVRSQKRKNCRTLMKLGSCFSKTQKM
jgi:hypothetical protein